MAGSEAENEQSSTKGTKGRNDVIREEDIECDDEPTKPKTMIIDNGMHFTPDGKLLRVPGFTNDGKEKPCVCRDEQGRVRTFRDCEDGLSEHWRNYKCEHINLLIYLLEEKEEKEAGEPQVSSLASIPVEKS